ncbi:hypothetical protein B0H11DRAFT_2402362 [Mycena galericulata]|nr:hypothetical protein B0H11DRAFT_2402362 [Mycena galericulata]
MCWVSDTDCFDDEDLCFAFLTPSYQRRRQGKNFYQASTHDYGDDEPFRYLIDVRVTELSPEFFTKSRARPYAPFSADLSALVTSGFGRFSEKDLSKVTMDESTCLFRTAGWLINHLDPNMAFPESPSPTIRLLCFPFFTNLSRGLRNVLRVIKHPGDVSIILAKEDGQTLLPLSRNCRHLKHFARGFKLATVVYPLLDNQLLQENTYLPPVLFFNTKMEEVPPVPFISTPAERCLYNDDIITQILNFYPERNARPKRALRNIALVCKALKEPALNELWRDLDSFVPLLRFLPSVQSVGMSYTFFVPPSPIQWTRFDQYAPRVRKMTLVEYRAPWSPVEAAVHPSVYLRIAKEHPAPLLPRLRYLRCNPLTTDAVMLIGPALRFVAIESADNQTALAFLAALSSKSPSVDDLRITLTGPFHPEIHSLLQTFRTVPSLDLNLRSTPLSAYIELDRILAQFRHKHFSVAALKQWETDIPISTFSPGFPDLEGFTVEGGFRVISAAVARIQSTKLSKFQVTVNAEVYPRGHAWSALMNPLFNRSYEWRPEFSLDLQYSSTPVNFTSLFGSLHLRNLRIFGLERYWPLRIQDSDIQMIAQKCPLIQTLTLDAGHDADSVSPPISSLVHLAKHCSKVFRTLNIRHMPLSPDSHGIETRAIARFIDYIFPEVQHVMKLAYPVPDPSWQEVEGLVMGFQASRAEAELGHKNVGGG